MEFVIMAFCIGFKSAELMNFAFRISNIGKKNYLHISVSKKYIPTLP